MNIFFRILLAVYAFFLTILSLITIIITFKHNILDSIYNYIKNDVFEKNSANIMMFIIALIFFALSITFLLSGFRREKNKKAVTKHTNIGEVRISLNTVENIALAASRKLSGVRDTKAHVSRDGDSVSITIKAVVLPDINIPTLSEDIQVKVKKSVEESSGIVVTYVRVLIENIYTGYKSRVE